MAEGDGPGSCDLWLYAALPKTEVYGLTAQLRRAAVSVPSNIAEGQGRVSTGEFKQFLGHARGSLLEIETQILIAQSLGYLQKEDSERLLRLSAEVGRILHGLIAALPNPSNRERQA